MPYNIEFLAVQTVAMLATALLLPGLRISGPVPAFFTVIGLALVNTYLWDAALFFEIPNSLSAQTFTLLAANGFIFWIVAKLLPGIEVSGCFAPIAAPVIFTVLSILIQRYGREIDWGRVYHSVMDFVFQLKASLKGGTLPTPVPNH